MKLFFIGRINDEARQEKWRRNCIAAYMRRAAIAAMGLLVIPAYAQVTLVHEAILSYRSLRVERTPNGGLQVNDTLQNVIFPIPFRDVTKITMVAPRSYAPVYRTMLLLQTPNAQCQGAYQFYEINKSEVNTWPIEAEDGRCIGVLSWADFENSFHVYENTNAVGRRLWVWVPGQLTLIPDYSSELIGVPRADLIPPLIRRH